MIHKIKALLYKSSLMFKTSKSASAVYSKQHKYFIHDIYPQSEKAQVAINKRKNPYISHHTRYNFYTKIILVQIFMKKHAETKPITISVENLSVGFFFPFQSGSSVQSPVKPTVHLHIVYNG